MKFSRKNRYFAWARKLCLEPRNARKRPPRFPKNNRPPRSSIYKWLAEWLHRRVIPGEGQLLKRMSLRQWYVFAILGLLALAQGHILRNPQDWSIPICHGLVLSWYERLSFRNKKVICKPATGSMTPTNWWNFVEHTDVLLEIEMHVWSPETLGNDHLGIWKTKDLPDLRLTSGS